MAVLLNMKKRDCGTTNPQQPTFVSFSSTMFTPHPNPGLSL